MKTTVRKSLFVVLVAFLTACIALFASNMVVRPSKADEMVEIPTEYTTVTEEAGFEVIDGANIHVEKSAIKFETSVSKSYYETVTADGATVEFIATAEAIGGKIQAMKFPVQPKFTGEDTEFILSTVLDFTAFESSASVEALKKIYALEFVTESYAKITDKDGNVTYQRAYKLDETGRNARSMQAIANEALLRGASLDLVGKYLTDVVRSEQVSGFVSLESGLAQVEIPNQTFEINSSVNLYVDGVKYVGTVNDDGKIVANGIEVAKNVKGGDKIVVSTFIDNVAYSTNLVVADVAITSQNLTVLHDISESTIVDETTEALRSGYIVFASDIDMAGVTWSAYTYNGKETDKGHFKGVFDGQGYTISNYSQVYNGSYLSAFFSYLDGATVKDLAFVNIKTNRLAGTISARAKNTTFENVYISATSTDNAGVAGTRGGLVAINNGGLILNNCYIEMPNMLKADTNTFISTLTHGTVSLNKVVFAGGHYTDAEGQVGLPATGVTGVINKDYFIASDRTDVYGLILVKQKATLADFIKDIVKARYSDIVEVTEENIVSILTTAQTKDFVQVDHIDMSKLTWYSGANSAYFNNNSYTTVKFSGTYNGLGFKIKNFTTAANPSYAGSLFVNVQSSAVIKNMIFENTIVAGSNGVVAGRAQSGSTFENIFIQVKPHASYVAQGHYQSGLVSINEGLICKNVFIDFANGSASIKKAFVASGAYCRDLKVSGLYMIGGKNNAGTVSDVYYTDHASITCTIYKLDGSTIATSNTDYFYYETVSAFATAMATNGANGFIQYAYKLVYGA